MNGQKAFPSIDRLAGDTALSSRSVKTHLALAVKLGWIERESCKRKGQAWRNYAYTPRFPIPPEAGENNSPSIEKEDGEDNSPS